MCVMSVIGDHYGRKWDRDFDVYKRRPFVLTPIPMPAPFPAITREEFDALRQEVLEMKRLLQNAKEIDETTGQAPCDDAEKMALLRKIAEAVGISMYGRCARSEDPINTVKGDRP